MNWQEACLKSNVDRAKRITKSGGVMYRELNGATSIKTKRNPFLRSATPEETEGHKDWTPV